MKSMAPLTAAHPLPLPDRPCPASPSWAAGPDLPGTIRVRHRREPAPPDRVEGAVGARGNRARAARAGGRRTLGPLVLILGWVGWLGVGCHSRGPDPFETYALALEQVRAAPLAPDWSPDATLILGDTMIQQAFSDAADLMLAELPEAIHFKLLAATVQVKPGIVRTGSRLEASAECSSCLAASIALHGDSELYIANDTGEMTRQLAWTGTLRAMYRVEAVREPRGDIRILAVAVQENDWDLDLELESDATTAPALLINPAREKLRRLVASKRRFSLELARLENEGLVALRGLRVRPVAEGIALDQSYMVVSPATVSPDLPSPEEGWVAVVPSGTLLALIRAAIHQSEPPEGARFDAVGLRLEEGGFVLDLLVYPERWHRKPMALVARGTLGINDEQALSLLSLEAEPVVAGRFAGPAVLVLRARIQEQIARALEASIPVSADKELGPGQAQVMIYAVSTRADQLVIRGRMVVAPGHRGQDNRASTDDPPIMTVSPKENE